jgi:epoxyqueuosine reductase
LELGAWLRQGLHGPLDYMPATSDRRANIRARFDWARAVLCVALFYDGQPRGEKGQDLSAHIARYARGRDYHRIFERRLKRLSAALIAAGLCTKAHYYVDTGPVLKRAWAEAAGMGWTGKNTCLIHPRLGSYMLLAELILDTAVEPDAPALPHCGTCRRCLDACPTQALPAPGVLDASRCLVTWNIESDGRTPREFWEHQGGWAAGCDICQEVCPFNAPKRIAPADTELAVPLPWQALSLADCIAMQTPQFDAAFQGSTLRRLGLKGLRLGAITAAGNVGAESCRATLQAAAREADPEIATRAQWALERLAARADA